MLQSENKYELKKLNYLIGATWFYIAFACLFPTVRTLTIGPDASASIGEYIFSVLPSIILGCLILFAAYILFKDKIQLKFTLTDWAVLAFFIINVVFGFLVSDDILVSIYGFRMTYFPVLAYFIFRFLPMPYINIKQLISGIIWILAAVAVIGIILYFFFYNEMVWMIEYTGGIVGIYFKTRMTSIFWTPVVFGTFMMAGFLYSFYRILKEKNTIWYILFAVFWICVLMSGSRGAIGAAVIGFLILMIVAFNFKKILIPSLLILVIFALNVLYMTDTIKVENVQNKQESQKQEGKPQKYIEWMVESSVETVSMKEDVSRVILWKQAILNFKEKPFGYGLGKSGHVASRFFTTESENVDVYATDGWFLKILNETGIIGLTSFLFFAAVFFIKSIQFLIRKKDLLYLFIFALFMVVNAQNIVSNVLDFFLFAPMFWLFIGIAENIRTRFNYGATD